MKITAVSTRTMKDILKPKIALPLVLTFALSAAFVGLLVNLLRTNEDLIRTAGIVAEENAAMRHFIDSHSGSPVSVLPRTEPALQPDLAEVRKSTRLTLSITVLLSAIFGAVIALAGVPRGILEFLVEYSGARLGADLTRQKLLLESKLEGTKRLLRERDDALQSRDEFLSIASHELKTPLTSLHLQLQIMARALQKSNLTTEAKLARVEKGFAVCEKQSTKLAELLNELLDLTRIRLGKLRLSKERTDLVAIGREVTERFRAEAVATGGGFELRAPDAIYGNWDPNRIDQVVTNLVSNAIKYGNGKPAEILLSTSNDGETAEIEIRDRGIGIPADMLDKIFLRFERAVEGDSISGLGLGLYITRQIVEAHGGKISVESELNRGSTFRISLPVGSPT